MTTKSGHVMCIHLLPQCPKSLAQSYIGMA